MISSDSTESLQLSLIGSSTPTRVGLLTFLTDYDIQGVANIKVSILPRPPCILFNLPTSYLEGHLTSTAPAYSGPSKFHNIKLIFRKLQLKVLEILARVESLTRSRSLVCRRLLLLRPFRSFYSRRSRLDDHRPDELPYEC